MSLLTALVVGAVSVGYLRWKGPDRQEVLMFGQQDHIAGTTAGFRILVRHRITQEPIEHARVSLQVTDKEGNNTSWGSFETDASGSIKVALSVPDLPVGDYQLDLEASSKWGKDKVRRSIRIVAGSKLLISSDKPLYQPGQIIHCRALATEEQTGKPMRDREVIFEVLDGKGNKVFHESQKSSDHGIASVDFQLATMVNEGLFTLRGIMGDETVERTVQVKPYVLPKFKVRAVLDRQWYLHHEMVKGFITGSYFFGKAMEAAFVRWNVRTLDASSLLLAEGEGRMDERGRFPLEFGLKGTSSSGFSVTQPVSVQLNAVVTDQAGHEESTTFDLVISNEALNISIVPEAGLLVLGVENIVYLRTTRPDGTPVASTVVVGNQTYRTDSMGLGSFRVLPVNGRSDILPVRATDEEGYDAVKRFSLFADENDAPFLLRPDKTVYRVGEIPRFTLHQPDGRVEMSSVFIDVIRHGMLVHRRHVSFRDASLEFELPLDPALTGELQVYAYILNESGVDRGCKRQVHILSDTGLNITTSLSKNIYLPGETALIDFTVTDASGRPAPSALGVSLVDDSVWSLAGRGGPSFSDEGNGSTSGANSRSGLEKEAQRFHAFQCAMDLQPKEETTLDGLIKSGVIDEGTARRVELMRGTDAYDELRTLPEYEAVFKLLDRQQEVYNLRESTGPVKMSQHADARQSLYKKIKQFATSSFVVLIVVLFLSFWIFDSWADPVLPPSVSPSSELRSYYAVQSRRANQWLGWMTSVPWGVYLLYLWMGNNVHVSGPFVVLLAAIEIGVLLWFMRHRIGNSKQDVPAELETEVKRLNEYQVWFGVHFLLIRIYMVILSMLPISGRELDWGLAGLAVFLVPLLVLLMFQSHIRRQCDLLGTGYHREYHGVLKFLLLVGVLVILTGMLLPSLATAKAKAQKIGMISLLKNVELAMRMAETDRAQSVSENPGLPRIRKYFPETLYWNPELITDDHGKVTLEIPLADSITTWRGVVSGNDVEGRMGKTALDVAVFQDFFVDLDLPESLTLGDVFSLPVACYNYLDHTQELRLELEPSDAFQATIQTQKIVLNPGEVASVYFPITMNKVGTHPLRVRAFAQDATDAIERQIKVKPSGKRIEHHLNDVLEETFSTTFHLPEGIVPDSQSLWVKLYPSRFSEVVEGLDGILQAPYGCFEQTSSVTYPNVLVLDYLQRVGRLTPEIESKAREFIQTGYQRLLTFEVSGGGFDWYGKSPANVCLTAYGILEFTDMARVHPVDPMVIERARVWLYTQQAEDGSWSERNRGSTWSGRGTMTCFVAWALASSGERSPELQRALHYLRTHPEECRGAYNMALAASAFLLWDRQDAFGLRLAEELESMTIKNGNETAFWKQNGSSVTYSRGDGFDVECSSLSAVALMRTGKWAETVRHGLNWISRQKKSNGTYGTTQANILALRALLAGASASLGLEDPSTIHVQMNGRVVEVISIQKENSDVFRQVDLTPWLHPGGNTVKLIQVPGSEMPVTLSGEYWLPDDTSSASDPSDKKSSTFGIDMFFSSQDLSVGENFNCNISIRNTSDEILYMPLVDIGIPPGMDIDTNSFVSLQTEQRISRFEQKGDRIRLYLRELSENEIFHCSYGLVARQPMIAQVPSSVVYEYYEPSNRAESKSVVLTVESR